MPQFGADGDVVDVQLHTVKVQNWDKTITTIPTHRLITDSFKNWRGMSQSGARRVKRAIFVDVSSIRFHTQDEVDHFTRFALLKDYIKNKEQELADYNEGLATEVDSEVNRRRLTSSSARPGARGTAVGDLLLHEHDRMGCLRRHPVGHLRSLAGNRAGIRAASISETGGFRFGKPQISWSEQEDGLAASPLGPSGRS
jgi:hypothetical protein